MSMLDWARQEVEIACRKENPDKKEGEFDYGQPLAPIEDTDDIWLQALVALAVGMERGLIKKK